MPLSQRAKQFQAFDALKGFREAIAAKEVQRVPKRELAEDSLRELNDMLGLLEKNQTITVDYYDLRAQNYLRVTGMIAKIDVRRGTLTVGECEIPFSAIDWIDQIR